jgi:hypothetical protein
MTYNETTIDIDQSEGASLDWLVAQVESVEVFVSASATGIKTCWQKEKPKQQYSPSSRWRQLGHLLDKYDVTFSRNGDQIEAFCPAVSQVDQVSALGPDRLTASCRAIAKAFFGNVGVVPVVLSN